MHDIAYIIASIFFILGLKQLGSAETARRGNLLSSIGMLIAVVATLLTSNLAWPLIVAGFVIGGGVGAVAAKRVQMTGMPEMVALFNGSGGIASLLVGLGSQLTGQATSPASMIPLYLAVLIGGVTFTGSLVAWGKLSGKLDGKPVLFKGQQLLNIILLAGLLTCGALYAAGVGGNAALWIWLGLAVVLSFAFGVMAVIPIGGADMPVVIALLNSYSGLAACAAGFIISNPVLIVSGALVGASGIILTIIMCKAMNRSLGNVLFSGFGAATSGGSGSDVQGEAKPISADDTYFILEAASSVVFVPGYGMAVAQSQHAVKELGALLEENGCEVNFAIHPVAGRMPGHMNVLLAEADVPYEQLVEPDDVNPNIAATDVAIVIGANDVVNPAARTDESSPLWGMPIINVDQAKTCIVLKRSLRPGYAGVENPLFFCENTRMLLGDAKDSVQALVSQFKDG